MDKLVYTAMQAGGHGLPSLRVTAPASLYQTLLCTRPFGP
jgi:hypothetical protein